MCKGMLVGSENAKLRSCRTKFYGAYTIAGAVKRLAYALRDNVGPAHYIIVLDGAFIFGADLVREVGRSVIDVQLVRVNRGYPKPHAPKVLDEVRWYVDAPTVIVDIVTETNRTLREVIRTAEWPKRYNVFTCVLFRKQPHLKVDFHAFDIPKNFYLYGYGMAPGRHLPHAKGVSGYGVKTASLEELEGLGL